MKSILLPLTAQIKDDNLTHIAALLAFQFRATLTGLFVRLDPRSAIPFMGEGLTAEMVQNLCDAAETEGLAQAKIAAKSFTKQIAQAGIHMAGPGEQQTGANARWTVVAGQIQDHVGRRARTADVALCTKPKIEMSDSQDIFHDLIYRSGRPVLMIPETCTDVPGRHILVAWNGRTEGARAVGAALPLIWGAEKVTLLQVGDPDPDRPTLENLSDYLLDHGVSTELIAAPKSDAPIGEQILTTAKDIKADMIVIGAYSHSRWREMILGGVTRHLVTHSDCSIFMSH